MSRILTGIQSTGTPHLGNILGAIGPAVELARKPGNDCYLFIADMHSLTSIKDPELLKENTSSVAAAWLAFGVAEMENAVFYRQSDLPFVSELTWYLNCLTPFPMLANAHSFKDKSENLSDVNAGLFTYPVLMASDILLYDADYVPVGKDQKQHLEMTRDICNAFNRKFGEVLVLPEPMIRESVQTVPGTDGRKMSKSYGNTINLFTTDKKLRKQVMKIETDSTPLEEPKNPDTCNVYKMYELLASEEDVQEMRGKYEGGNFGYGHAKQELFELLKEEFGEERERYQKFIQNPDEIEDRLKAGAEEAAKTATATLARVREASGYKKFAYISHKI